VTSSISIEYVEPSSSLVDDAARLHVASLSDTLTSNRGAKTLGGIYRRLIRKGHSLFVARVDNTVVGGVMVMIHDVERATLFSVVYRPWSWISVLRHLGVRELVAQLRDLAHVMRCNARLAPHDYIVALYVDQSARRHGVARTLIARASAEATSRGVGLAVDTLSTNEPARTFYHSVGFREFAVTPRSQVFTWARE